MQLRYFFAEYWDDIYYLREIHVSLTALFFPSSQCSQQSPCALAFQPLSVTLVFRAAGVCLIAKYILHAVSLCDLLQFFAQRSYTVWKSVECDVSILQVWISIGNQNTEHEKKCLWFYTAAYWIFTKIEKQCFLKVVQFSMLTSLTIMSVVHQPLGLLTFGN